MWRSIFFALISFSLTASAHAAGISLQSHRAIYELSLKRAEDGNGITGLSGRLVMEWSKNCEGYILNQRMLTQVTDARGKQVINDFRITSWESLDGLNFRYSSRNEIDGKLVEEISGRASRNESGKASTAKFTKPEVEQIELPGGTVFPTEQVIMLLRAAESSEKTRSILLFDGSRTDSIFETFSVIGAEQAPLAVTSDSVNAILAGQRSWSVQLAYFPLTPQPDLASGTPEFEVGFRLFQNGVATDIVLDYGDFALGGSLSQLEGLPRPEC